MSGLASIVSGILPAGVRQWITRARREYVRRVHGFSPADLRRALERLGLGPGSVVMVHSSLNGFVGFQGVPRDVAQTLRELVGPEGTLLMPTLSFSRSVEDYVRRDPLFDLRRTVSRVGLLTEVFRRGADVQRSLHPTHSVAACGRVASEMLAGHEAAGSPCGRTSPYGRLLDHDGWILFLGTRFQAMTFIHYLEEEAEGSLPFTLFAAEEYEVRCKDGSGTLRTVRTRVYAREMAGRRTLQPLERALRRSGRLRESRVGRVRLIAARASEVAETYRALTREGEFCIRLARRFDPDERRPDPPTTGE